MKPCVAVVLLALGSPGLFGAQHWPERVFGFPGKVTELTVNRWTDELRRARILAALSAPDRDSRLRSLVGSIDIEGEEWFDLRGMRVQGDELGARSNLSRICWDHAIFHSVDLRGTDLFGAVMRGVRFESTNMEAVNLDNAHLEDSEFRGCRLKGINFQSTRFGPRTRFVQCDLDESRLDNCSMRDVVFDHCSMRKVVLDGSDLRGGKFTRSDLTGASLVGTDASCVDFYGSTLNDTDLRDSDLCYARLQGAVLTSPLRAIRTRIGGTFFGDLDLSKLDISYLHWVNDEYKVGEELAADGDGGSFCGGTNPERCIAFSRRTYAQAEAIYRVLSQKYRQLGYAHEYLKLRYRCLEMRRKHLALHPNAKWSLERIWLSVSHFLDGYGTRIDRLFASFSAMISIFALIYLVGWTALKRDWARWYSVDAAAGPRARGSDTNMGPTGYVESDRMTPRDVYEYERGVRKLWTLLRLAGLAVLMSLQSACLFAAKVVDVADAYSKVRGGKQERLLPTGMASVLAGVQAALGLLFFYALLRIVVVMAGV